MKGGVALFRMLQIMFQVGDKKSYIYTVVARNKICLLVGERHELMLLV